MIYRWRYSISIPYHAAASEVSKTSIVHCSGAAPALTAGVAVMLLCLRRLLGQEKHTLSIASRSRVFLQNRLVNQVNRRSGMRVGRMNRAMRGVPISEKRAGTQLLEESGDEAIH